MSRKNPVKKTTVNKPLNTVVISKEVGTTYFNYTKNLKYKSIGNCRYIENYLGLRINGKSENEPSKFYQIFVKDIDSIFAEPLSVASVFLLQDRYADDTRNKVGNCRVSKSQRALNIKLDNGDRFTIMKVSIEKCLKDIFFIGNVSTIIEGENNETS